MTLKSFLHHANTYLGATVAAETIASVQMLAEARVMTANHRRAILAIPRAGRLTMALKRVPDEESRNRSVIEYAFQYSPVKRRSGTGVRKCTFDR